MLENPLSPESAAHDLPSPLHVDAAAQPYDALLLCSFGGPNRPEDVLPFLRNVVAGKGVPEERLQEVAEHYFHFDGVSPINAQNLALRAALEDELRRRHINLPVIWGNRNWHPFSVDALRDAVNFGARKILALVTSAYASYSGSRQYREQLAGDVAALGSAAPAIDILRPFFNDPGFITANFDAIVAAANSLPNPNDACHVAYVTHSIPTTMQIASAETGPGYQEQHEDVQQEIDRRLQELGWNFTSSLSYCSRSGDPRVPWLEPDINDHLAELAARGVKQVVIAPIGFISDHMEVAFDLDIEAQETATELEIAMARASTASLHPAFVSGLVDMVLERAARERGENPPVPVAGKLAPFPDVAPPGSCRQRHDVVTGIPVIAGEVD